MVEEKRNRSSFTSASYFQSRALFDLDSLRLEEQIRWMLATTRMKSARPTMIEREMIMMMVLCSMPCLTRDRMIGGRSKESRVWATSDEVRVRQQLNGELDRPS